MIVVTGLLSSGTTPLARMLHQSGVLMGRTMLFPPPGGEPEWEDDALVSRLVSGRPIDPELFPGYVSLRRAQHALWAKQMPLAPTWGVKSPWLLPYLHDLRRAARRAKEPFVLVLTKRARAACDESLTRRQRLATKHIDPSWNAAQDALETAWKANHEKADLIVPIDRIWSDPAAVLRDLSHLAGVPFDRRGLYGIEDRSGRRLDGIPAAR